MARVASDGTDPLTTVLDIAADSLCGSDGNDRLLAELVELRRLRDDIDQRLRYLIAYAREFVYPRPYKLVDLATATGLSMSGIRIFYGQDEIDAIAAALADKASPALTTTPRD